MLIRNNKGEVVDEMNMSIAHHDVGSIRQSPGQAFQVVRSGSFPDKLLEREYSQETQRAELQKRIVSEVEQVKTARGNNVSDEIYRQFLEGGEGRRNLETGELSWQRDKEGAHTSGTVRPPTRGRSFQFHREQISFVPSVDVWTCTHRNGYTAWP
jgi:hypothetical protein